MGSNPSLPAWALFSKILGLSANLCKIIFILNKLFAPLVTLKTEQIEGCGWKNNNLKSKRLYFLKNENEEQLQQQNYGKVTRV